MVLKRGADLVYAFRFVRLMTQKWQSWDAYKLGIIDAQGNRVKGVPLDTPEKKNAYTPFIRLAANIKRMISKVPLVGSRLGSFATALFLLKENFNVSDRTITESLQKCGVDVTDLLKENNEWFVLDDKMLGPGMYQLRNHKMLNNTFEEIALPKDKVRIYENCYPVGSVFGIDIYEAVHVKTQQKIYISTGEIIK